MATTMFKPSTDTFGQLTLGSQAFDGLTRGVRREHINLLIMLAFLITLVVAGIGLYQMDQALFAHPHPQHVAVVNTVAVDYD